MPDPPSPVRLSNRRTAFAGRFVRVVTIDATSDDGRHWTYEVVEHAPAVAVVAIDDQQRVLLIRQPRPAVGAVLLELPAGLVDPGEDPLTAAQRELREETGAEAAHWQPLSRFYTSPGFTDEELFVFLATGLTHGQQDLGEHEQIEVVWEPVSRIPTLIEDGSIHNATALIGLLMYLRRA